MVTKVLELQANVDGAVKGLNKVDSEIENINKGLETTEKSFVSANKDAEQLNTTVDKTANASKSAKKGFKAMGVALKAVGIGLLIKGLAVVSELFMSNQKVVDGFNTAINMVTIAFNDLFQFVSSNVGSVTKFFKSIFDDPLESIINFGVAIKNNIVERVKSGIEVFGLLGKAIKQVFEGDFQGAINTAKEAGKEYIDVLTGVDNSVDKITEVVEEAIPAITNYTQSTYESAKANVELSKAAELAAVKNQGLIEQYDIQAEQLRQIRDNEFKTIEERIQANNDLKTVLDEQEAAMLEQVDLQIRQAQVAFDLNNNQENYIALLEARNEKQAVLAQIEGFRSEQDANSNALLKEKIELQQTSIDGTNERTIAERKATDELIKDDAKRIQAQIDTLDAEIKIETKRLETKRALYKEGTQAFEDANQELLNYISESNIQRESLSNDLTGTILTNEKELRDSFIKGSTDILNSLTSLAEQSQQKFADLNQAVLDNENLIDKEKQKLLNKNNERAKKAFDSAKALQIATALINTYASAAAALAPPPVGAGPIAGPFLAGASILSGLLQVNNIRKQKFEGASLGTSSTGSSSAGGGGTSAPSQPQAPSFNVVGQSGFNQIAGALGQQQPVQAFVVASEVTTQQQLDNQIVSTATF
jgi:hypothetical protein